MTTSKLPDSFSVALEASTDLSAKLHHFAKAVNGDKCTVADDGGTVIGTIIEAAAAGKAATVQFGGIGKVIAGGAVTANDRIASDTNAQAVTAAVGDFEVGTALNTAATGELVEFIYAPGRRHA